MPLLFILLVIIVGAAALAVCAGALTVAVPTVIDDPGNFWAWAVILLVIGATRLATNSDRS